jgi:hypothetical protein
MGAYNILDRCPCCKIAIDALADIASTDSRFVNAHGGLGGAMDKIIIHAHNAKKQATQALAGKEAPDEK